MSDSLLAVCNVAVNYGRQRVLSDINLSLQPGDWLCLLGPNGSGKTTLLRCIGGQIDPIEGKVFIAGHCMRSAPEKAKQLLGYGHAPDRLPELLTARQCLEIYAAAHHLQNFGGATLELAAKLKLTGVLDRTVGTYSLGMRQKLSILLALIAAPALIVLDEVFNGLDPASALVVKAELTECVQSKRCAVVLATHSLDIVSRHATRVALLLDGRLATSWNNDELATIRSRGADALEAAMAAAVAA